MKEKEYLYHELKRITDNRVKGESKSLDQYIELRTKIVREVSENLKNKCPFKFEQSDKSIKNKLLSSLNKIPKLEK